MTDFSTFIMTGTDTDKFLQGQVTADIGKLGHQFLPTAICNLKGRVQFGLWLRRITDGVQIVISADMADDFAKHVKKFGTFSKIVLSAAEPIYPVISDGLPSFGMTDENQETAWQQASIATGNYWITQATSGLYQPQELRLHQRGGVAYDKGCYLGQEIVARLWFKAAPKAWLHRIVLSDHLSDKVQIVCQSGNEALVVARPDELVGMEVLPIKGLVGDISRQE